MKKSIGILNFFTGTKFLISLFMFLVVLSTLNIIFSTQIAGHVFSYLLKQDILSYEQIQNLQAFSFSDIQRAYWFGVLANVGAILSCYAFFVSLRNHEKTGTGTGAVKLIYLGLVIIFSAGSIDSVFGFKGITVLQKHSEVSKITLANGTVKNLPFKIKANNIISDKENKYIDISLTMDGNVINTKLNPWRQTHVDNYTMYYYAIQNALPMVIVDVKSLTDIMQEPSMIGLQVGRGVENKQENVSFKILRINPPKSPVVLGDNKIEGFTNDGRSVDYILKYNGASIALRTYEYYPNLIAVGNNKGEFSLLPFGLSVVNKTGWEVLAEYLDYIKKNNIKDNNKVFSKLKTLTKYDENIRPVIQKNVLTTASIIEKIKLPYILQLDKMYPLKQVTLNVQYEPSLYLSYLGLFLMIAGFFVKIVFSRRIKD